MMAPPRKYVWNAQKGRRHVQRNICVWRLRSSYTSKSAAQPKNFEIGRFGQQVVCSKQASSAERWERSRIKQDNILRVKKHVPFQPRVL